MRIILFSYLCREYQTESMAGVNKVILIGNIGRDPEVVSFEQVKKASFSLATTEHHKTKDGSKVEETEWHNIVCWRGLADTAEKYLRKGMQLYVEGRIKSRVREDKEGFKRRVVEIVAENFKILSRMPNSSLSPNDAVTNSTESVYEEILNETFEGQSSKASINLSKLLSEDTEMEKLGDLPF